MKNKITNVSKEDIILFVKREDIEEQVTIQSEQSIIVDDYETKTIRIFSRKGLIKIEPTQIVEEASANTSDEYNTMTNIDPNSDEVMDNFHTTETHKVVTEEESGDVKVEVDGISTSVPKALLEDMNKYHGMNKEAVVADIIKAIEGEVEQYVESGFIKGEWSDEETKFLKKNYPTKGRSYCSTHLNRNETSVQKKINALGIKKKKKNKKKK